MVAFRLFTSASPLLLAAVALFSADAFLDPEALKGMMNPEMMANMQKMMTPENMKAAQESMQKMMNPEMQAKMADMMKDPSKLKDMLGSDKMEQMQKALGSMGGMKQKAPKVPARTQKDPMKGLAEMLKAHAPGVEQEEQEVDPLAALTEQLKGADLGNLGAQMQEMMKGVNQEELMEAMKNFDPSQMQNMMKSMMGGKLPDEL